MANVTLDNFVYPNQEAEWTIKSILDRTYPFPANNKYGLLLHGRPGTAKSTIAELIVNSWRKPYIDLCEANGVAPGKPDILDCRTDRTISFIRSMEEAIRRVPLNLLDQHYKIIEEVNELDKTAAVALSRVMDLGCAIFVLTTNDLDGVDQKTVGRCITISFEPANASVYAPFLKQELAVIGVPNVASIPQKYFSNWCTKNGNNIRDIVSAAPIIKREIEQMRTAKTIP